MGKNKNEEIVLPVNHWQNGLDAHIKKIINRLDFSSFSDEEKKWYVKEIEEEQKIVFLLFKSISNNEMELQRSFNTVVGIKNSLIFSHNQKLNSKPSLDWFSPENGFYSRIIPFIEFQLLKFVNKNRNLKFGVEERLKIKSKDETLPYLFKDLEKFKRVLLKLEEKKFIEFNTDDQTYRWKGKDEIGTTRGKGLQLVALSIKLEPFLKQELKKAKQCRAYSSFFNYPINAKNFESGRVVESEKYFNLFSFLKQI